ncbi:MAG: hypothetical protein LWX01_03975 [Deltaproteobacteria bacterium]|nr:hypothetical protein [Deltaproteobacteria bacterium]MDL1960845.1 hypothetical protein [Deltaproteobacteria bacterium]
MTEKSVKTSSKKRKFVWILGIFFLSAALLSGSLYQCLPLLIKKLVPIVAKSEGYAVRLSEVRKSYGLITLERIRISHKEIRGEIQRISVEYSLWPFGLKEITLEKPDFKVIPGASAGMDFGFNRTLVWLLGKVSIVNGEIELKTTSFVADLSAFSITRKELLSLAQGPNDLSPASIISGRISVMTPEIQADGDLKGMLDWNSTRFHLMSKGKIIVDKFQGRTVYNLKTSGRIDPQMGGLSAEADLAVHDLCSIFPFLSEETTKSDSDSNISQSCPVSISASIRYLLAEDLKVSGKLALKDTRLSSISGIPIIQGTWRVKASPDLKNGYIDAGFELRELPISIKLSWPGENGNQWEAVARISSTNYDFSNIKGPILSGLGDIIADVFVTPDSWKVSMDLGVKDLSWARDENHAFEGISSKIELLANYDGSFKNISWKGNLEWSEGAALVYPWFLDLTQFAGSVETIGTLDKKKLLFNKIAVSGPFELMAREISLDCNLNDNTAKLSQWKMPKIQVLKAKGKLEIPYKILFQEPFSAEYDFLNDLMPKGTWLVELEQGSLRTEIKTDLSFSGHDVIQGMDLNLGYPIYTDICQPGLIKWDRLTWPPLSLEKTKIPLTVCKGNLSCGPIKIPVAQGEISLKEISWDWPASSLKLGELRLIGVDLKSFWPDLPLSVDIEGDLDQGKWSDPRLCFDGEILVNTTGGKIRFQNIWIEPLAPMPSFGADVVFHDLDLAQLSDAAQFGHITGKLTGHIDHLIMSGGQPESFELVMENDSKAPGPKRISLEAVENISILGGGGSIPFFGRMFKEYPYRRIGISCSLNNDLFTLHGLIKKDGKEYLVERGLIRGVNVINRNPDGKISFKDMLDRLKRITRTGQE